MVYLIHFEQPYKHAKHYIGFVENESDLARRIERHKTNQGSKLIKAVNKAGIKWAIARVWPNGDRNFERMLKNQKNAPRICPICNKKLSKEKFGGS